jgi:hypothetical protein
LVPILESACCGQLSRGGCGFSAVRQCFDPQILRKRLVFQWSSDLNFHGTTRDILIGSFDSLTDDVTVDVLENSPDNETDSIVISLPLDKTTTGKIFGRLKVFEN